MLHNPWYNTKLNYCCAHVAISAITGRSLQEVCEKVLDTHIVEKDYKYSKHGLEERIIETVLYKFGMSTEFSLVVQEDLIFTLENKIRFCGPFLVYVPGHVLAAGWGHVCDTHTTFPVSPGRANQLMPKEFRQVKRLAKLKQQ